MVIFGRGPPLNIMLFRLKTLFFVKPSLNTFHQKGLKGRPFILIINLQMGLKRAERGSAEIMN
jgi:hypothetical protein